MKTILYKSDSEGVTAIGNGNPLPVVISGYDSNSSFNFSAYSENSVGGTLIKAATTGKSIYITDILISTEQATSFWLYNDTGTKVLGNIFLAANGTYQQTFSTPIKVASGEALWIKSVAQVHFSVTVSGYVV